MKTETKSQIHDFIVKNGKTRPSDLAEMMGLSSQMVHRHLKALISEGVVRKLGLPPLVFYEPVVMQATHNFKNDSHREFIEKYFSYLSPIGNFSTGAAAFVEWCQSISQIRAVDALAEAYVSTRTKFLPKDGLVLATEKFRTTFPQGSLDEVYYADFWALPQFGRTHLALLLTMGKSGQSIRAIRELAEIVKPTVVALIRREKIDAIVFAPHSIPRKVQFLEHLSKLLDLSPSHIRMKKIFPAGIPVAQKSLPKLQDRILNAKNTIFLADKVTRESRRILVIDDAVGSGATMNVIAEQLKEAGAKHVVGFAIVGSLKGFEVIGEI